MLSLGLFCALLPLGPRGRAQQPAPKPVQKPSQPPAKPPETDESSTIRISSALIAVPVSVTDAAGEPVRNLKAEDFRIQEEGQPQQVSSLGEPGQTPVELVLLFDVSGSIRERFEFERQAALRFLREVLRPIDTAAIFSIGLKPKLVLARTKSVEQAVSGMMAIELTKEATAFFDSVGRAANYVSDNASPGSRRVLVAITDGEDNQSEDYKLDGALRVLQRSDSLFYSINPSGPSIRLNQISLKGHAGMEALAKETGGTAFLPDKLEDLDVVFRQIAAELQAQYLLGYYSTDERNDGKFRRIEVRVPKRADLRVRARQGYYAPKE